MISLTNILSLCVNYFSLPLCQLYERVEDSEIDATILFNPLLTDKNESRRWHITVEEDQRDLHLETQTVPLTTTSALHTTL